MPKLTAKQARFVEEYLVDLNATQAAIRAGYSKRRASEIGYQLLHKTTVAVAVAAAMEKRSERTQITQDWVLDRLKQLADSSMCDYLDFGDDGEVRLDFSDLSQDAMAAMSEITQEVYIEGKGDDAKPVRRTKFKLYDKRLALVDIGRHLGMFTDNMNLSGSVGVRHEDALKRLK